MNIEKGHTVLEIGTGSGYQTAVLCELGAKVFSIERQQELFKKTKLFLSKLGYRPRFLSFGDGYKGLPEYAPFDSIIVTAGAPYVPKPLLAQLKIGGRLVIPVGDDPQIMHLYVRTAETTFEKKEFGFELFRANEEKPVVVGKAFKSSTKNNYIVKAGDLSGNGHFDAYGNFILERINPVTNKLITDTFARQ